MLTCGLVGLPLAGKTTIYNVVTHAGAATKAFAGGSMDPHRAVVPVPDPRFDRLVEIFRPRKATPASICVVDVAGLSLGEAQGPAVGRDLLTFAADATALLHIVRAFGEGLIPHPEGNVDPARDWRLLETELILRDLQVIDNRLSRMDKKGRGKRSASEAIEAELLERCQAHLMEEQPLRTLGLAEGELKSLSGYAFLTLKPQVLVLNAEETAGHDGADLAALAQARGLGYVRVYGQIEAELADLAPEDRLAFLEDLGVGRLGRDRLLAEAYRHLGLISFYTVGEDEVKAWTVPAGSTAVEAAGAIHSDLARGFIRAQVVSYDDLIAHGCTLAGARQAGKLRLEGRDYLVADGDILEIRFNV
jgi:ribosome-binding ATPase